MQQVLNKRYINQVGKDLKLLLTYIDLIVQIHCQKLPVLVSSISLGENYYTHPNSKSIISTIYRIENILVKKLKENLTLNEIFFVNWQVQIDDYDVWGIDLDIFMVTIIVAPPDDPKIIFHSSSSNGIQYCAEVEYLLASVRKSELLLKILKDVSMRLPPTIKEYLK